MIDPFVIKLFLLAIPTVIIIVSLVAIYLHLN